jgi:subtilisin family serine protease
MAPRASLIAADFMDEDLGDEFNAIRAIDYSIGENARIINNSWSNFCSHSIQAAFERWQDRDVIFVNAAGNDSMLIDASPIFPANLDLLNGITVGSVNRFGERSQFSNFGRNVSVYAPGEDIFSLSTADFGLGFLVPRSGTSMATAFVSGALALVLSAKPEAKAVDVVRELKKAASVENAERQGIVNVKELIQGLN